MYPAAMPENGIYTERRCAMLTPFEQDKPCVNPSDGKSHSPYEYIPIKVVLGGLLGIAAFAAIVFAVQRFFQ